MWTWYVGFLLDNGTSAPAMKKRYLITYYMLSDRNSGGVFSGSFSRGQSLDLLRNLFFPIQNVDYFIVRICFMHQNPKVSKKGAQPLRRRSQVSWQEMRERRVRGEKGDIPTGGGFFTLVFIIRQVSSALENLGFGAFFRLLQLYINEQFSTISRPRNVNQVEGHFRISAKRRPRTEKEKGST